MPAASDSPPAPTGPHLLLCEQPDRRALRRRLAAVHPGARRQTQRSFAAPPQVRRGRVGVWHWSAGEDELRARATQVLLHFVHPLVGSRAPYCVGFPFPEDVFARRSLSFADRELLDLEDIGELLRAGPAVSRSAPGGLRAHRFSGASSDALARPAAGVRLDAGELLAAGAPLAACRDETLDPGQRAAVGHARGPARVLAAAGSGKTKTLIARVAELVARGVDPGSILMLAFNRKAAEQLEERLARLGIATTRRIDKSIPGPAGGAVHCATFNAFGYRYQKQVMRARFTLDTRGTGARALMHAALERAGLGAAALRPARGSDPAGACLVALARVRASLEPPADVELRLPSCGEQPLVVAPFTELHEHYSILQRRDGRQSFDDQLYLAVADMLADPRHRALIQRRYAHVLVDEFQDLNAVQLALVDLLSRPRRDLFVVGDDDQLIYGWRFADLGGILGFHERMPPRPWSATYTLGTNYRCSREIVAAGSRLIAHNTRREAKEVLPREGAARGSLRICAAASWRERAAEMCAFLRAERARLGCEWRALAVLCRYRAQQLPVALILDLEGIPRTALLSYRLFSDPAARLVRAYIDAVATPHRLRGAGLRLLVNRPERYVPRAAVEALAAADVPWRALVELAAAEPAAGPRRLSELVNVVKALARELRGTVGVEHACGAEGARPAAAAGGASGRPPALLSAAQLVSAVVDDLGLQRHWEGSGGQRPPASGADGPDASGPESSGPDTSGPDSAGPYQVLDALLLLADLRPDLPAFLAEWDRLLADEEAHAGMADDSLAREEDEDDRVVIGTIHAAKGREYRSVVLPEYACDLAELEAAQVEEERRVLYVGVTRAKDAALITADPARPGPPRFLLELAEPEAGAESGAPGPHWADAWRPATQPRSG